jgi:hypothetical protein
MCTGKDRQCPFRRPGSLKTHAYFASPRTFGGKAEADVHGESVIEVGSPNCVVKIPRSRLAERD